MTVRRPEMVDTSEGGRTRTPRAAGPASAVAAFLAVAGISEEAEAVVISAAAVLAVDTLEEEAPEAVAATAVVVAEALVAAGTGKIVRSERSR